MSRQEAKTFVITMLAIFALAVASLSGQTSPHTMATITGDAAAHPVSATHASARWVLFITGTGNSAVVRIGDSSTSVSVGAPIAAGGGFFMPPIPSSPGVLAKDQIYDLHTIYYYAATSDTMTVLWGY